MDANQFDGLVRMGVGACRLVSMSLLIAGGGHAGKGGETPLKTQMAPKRRRAAGFDQISQDVVDSSRSVGEQTPVRLADAELRMDGW